MCFNAKVAYLGLINVDLFLLFQTCHDRVVKIRV